MWRDEGQVPTLMSETRIAVCPSEAPSQTRSSAPPPALWAQMALAESATPPMEMDIQLRATRPPTRPTSSRRVNNGRCRLVDEHKRFTRPGMEAMSATILHRAELAAVAGYLYPTICRGPCLRRVRGGAHGWSRIATSPAAGTKSRHCRAIRPTCCTTPCHERRSRPRRRWPSAIG